ncbi:MAG: ATP-binding protein [Gammaproteobacteria bacterium]|nr:ATP-binding protein [Gammaproteobacteria bacterium]
MNISTTTEEMQDEAYDYMASRSKAGPFLISSFFLIFIYVSPIYTDQPTEILTIGLSMLAVTLFRITNEFGFDKFYSKNKSAWKKLYAFGITCHAFIWGIFCLIVVAEYGIHWVSLLILICTAGLSAGGIIAVIPHQKLSLAYQSLILLPTAIYSFTLDNAAAYSISYMFLCYLVFMSIMSKKLHQEYWVSVQNVRLLDDRAKELEISRDKAVALAKSKSDFLSTMSHELRTPMNGILGMSQLLELTTLDEEQSEYVSTIQGSTSLLLNVINDILDYSKMEAGKVTLERRHFNVNTLIDDINKLMGPAVLQKNLEFLIDIDPNCPSDFIGDQGRIRQILLNLLGNAIKFTNSGSISISVKCVGLDEEILVRFSISDTGIGINLSQQSQLFSHFTQADTSTTRKFGGTGLGLAISKKLVDLMGGKIGVESKEDVGSTFWFEISLPATGVTESTTTEKKPTRKFEKKPKFVIDENVLSSLKQTMEEQYSDLIKAHISSSTDCMKKIHQSIEDQNITSLKTYLNSLKSSSASIGAKILEAEIMFIEKQVDDNKIPENAEYEKLLNLFNDVVVVLKNELN